MSSSSSITIIIIIRGWPRRVRRSRQRKCPYLDLWGLHHRQEQAQAGGGAGYGYTSLHTLPSHNIYVLSPGLTELAGLHGNDKEAEPEEDSLDDNSTLEGKATTPKVTKRKAPEPVEADQKSASEEEPQLQQEVKKQPAKKQHAKKKTRCWLILIWSKEL